MSNSNLLFIQMAQDPKPAEKPRYQPRGDSAVASISTDGSSTYNVKGLMYPTDLLAPESDNQYGSNYVIFYINVHESSQLWDQDEYKDQYVADAPKNLNSELAGANYSSGTLNTLGVGAAAAASAKANIVGNTASAVGVDLNTSKAKTASAAVGGLGGAAAISQIDGTKHQYKRMKQCIALHMPVDMNVRYSVEWNVDDMAGASAIAEVVQGLGDNATKILAGTAAFGVAGAAVGLAVGGTKGAIKGAKIAGGAAAAVGVGGTAVKEAGGYLTGVALGTPGIGRMISKSSGVVANPKKEQIFKRDRKSVV